MGRGRPRRPRTDLQPLLHQLGLRPNDLASVLAVSKQFIAQIESGRSPLPLAHERTLTLLVRTASESALGGRP